MSKEKKICKYLDMPIQHISNHILKSMKRGASKEKINDLDKDGLADVFDSDDDSDTITDILDTDSNRDGIFDIFTSSHDQYFNIDINIRIVLRLYLKKQNDEKNNIYYPYN